MGDDADAKWHRALLKKLRSAVAVKTRVDAGDAASLQKSQAGKGTKRAIDDALRALKQAGLGRDSRSCARRSKPARGKARPRWRKPRSAGRTAAPTGSPRARSASSARRARRRTPRAAAAAKPMRLEKNLFSVWRFGARRVVVTTTTTTTPRNPHVSGHVFAACKRAVYALHALAKEPEREGAAYVFSLQKRFLSATASLSSPASLVAAADARLAGIALWSLAKASRRAIDAEGVDRPTAEKAKAATARLGRAVSERFAAVARLSDARGRGDGGVVRRKPRDGDARVPGPSRRGARRGKGAAQTRRAGGLGQPAGCRQRAVGVRAPARRRRRGGGEATGRRAGGRERRKNSFDERREPPGDERRAVGARHAPRGRSVSGRRRNRRGARLRRRRGGARRAGTSRRGASGTRQAVRCFSERRETRLRGAFAKRTSPRCRRWRRRARLGVGRVAVVPAEKPGEHALGVRGALVDRALAEPLAAAFFATATAAGRARRRAREAFPPNKKRRSLRNRVARVARARRRARDAHLDFCDVSFF